MALAIIIRFIPGYTGFTLKHTIKVNKTVSAVVTGAVSIILKKLKEPLFIVHD